MSKQKQYWFSTRRYGLGWGLPIAWQGWVTYGTFVVLCLLAAAIFPPSSNRDALTTSVMILLVLLVLVCWAKGEPLRWRWGGK